MVFPEEEKISNFDEIGWKKKRLPVYLRCKSLLIQYLTTFLRSKVCVMCHDHREMNHMSRICNLKPLSGRWKMLHFDANLIRTGKKGNKEFDICLCQYICNIRLIPLIMSHIYIGYPMYMADIWPHITRDYCNYSFLFGNFKGRQAHM